MDQEWGWHHGNDDRAERGLHPLCKHIPSRERAGWCVKNRSFCGHIIKNVICSLGRTRPLSMDRDKWVLYGRWMLIANSGLIGRYGGRCLEAASWLISRVLDSVWTCYLWVMVLYLVPDCIAPLCHWLPILGFVIGEELESCLVDVYKATLLDL